MLSTDKEHLVAEIDRIANSSVLHGSESLCKLLRYLATYAIEHPGGHLKEYQIATEVFGRSPDFDSQLDSTVRVQVGRLRQKLHDYYASDGSNDPVVVDLPKGTYLLGFHAQTPKPSATKDGSEKTPRARPALDFVAPSSEHRWQITAGVLALLLVLAMAIAASLWSGRNRGDVTKAATDPPSLALSLFWQHFASSPEEPWVVFSNASFVGRPETGMRYRDPAHDVQAKILDHYTGVGEVLAVHELDHAFAALHREIRVKRGSLLSLDDVKNNDVIFVGSPAENLTLLEIPGTQEFIFQRAQAGPRPGDLGILNVHPQLGEPKMFFATPNDEPLTDDYAVIALQKGLNPSHSVLILAGTTTLGTQAAVEYVCHPDSLEQLLLRMAVSSNKEVQPFEAVLHVKVTRGVPLASELVALRKIASEQ